MSHTPSYPKSNYTFANVFSGTNSGGAVTWPTSGSMSRYDLERSLGTDDSSEKNDLREEITKLKGKIVDLETVIVCHTDQIKELYELIDSLQKNSSGQRGHQGPSYWQER